MAESGYTADVRNLLLPMGVYPLKLSLPYTAGVADSWYDGVFGDLWVEWKYYATLPKVINLVSGKKPKLSKLQQDWLLERVQRGRNVAVIVASRWGGVIMRYPTWTLPMPRQTFLEQAASKHELAQRICDMVNRPRESA